MSNILDALTPDMRAKLRSYITAHQTWNDDPAQRREECRSFAAEFVNMVIGEIGDWATQEQQLAHIKNEGPSPATIQMQNALARLEVAK